jgi:peptide-methionine (S)-S-oxide reductase
VEYDPAVVSYEQLLEVFWDIHDPTTLNRQGPDIGSQYRSAIFYNSEEERAAALSSIDSIHRSGRLGNRRVVTQVVPAKEFYPAEEYHQRYLEKHGRASCRFC